MDSKTFYTTLEKPGTAEFKERGSKFIGYAFPVQTAEEFKAALQLTKKEHAKASHHCYAYRLGLDGNNFRVNDDGEPSGTAGKPTATVVLQTLPFIQKPIELNYRLQFDYTMMNPVMMIIKQFNCTVLQQEAQLFCMLTIGIPINRQEEVLYRLKELLTVEYAPC